MFFSTRGAPIYLSIIIIFSIDPTEPPEAIIDQRDRGWKGGRGVSGVPAGFELECPLSQSHARKNSTTRPLELSAR